MEKKLPITEYYVIKTINNCEYICTPILIDGNYSHGFKLINSKTPDGKTIVSYDEVKEIITFCEYMKRLSEKILQIPEICENEQLVKLFNNIRDLNSKLNETLETPNNIQKLEEKNQKTL